MESKKSIERWMKNIVDNLCLFILTSNVCIFYSLQYSMLDIDVSMQYFGNFNQDSKLCSLLEVMCQNE